MSQNLKVSLDTLQRKAKERTVKTQDIEYDIETLHKRIKAKVIKLDPEYQRRHRWTDETSSRLIESLILNIPIPTIFISQDIDVDDENDQEIARYTVIDGQQRLTAIVRFLDNALVLEGLRALSELNGMTRRGLPPFLARRLEERTIKCLRIDSTLDPQVKYDIFERLNTGSVKLEPQELRNATVRGYFNKTLKDLAELPAFREMLQIDPSNPEASVKVQKMEDVELVLRFFALRNRGYLELKKGFRDFLTDKMGEFSNITDLEIDRMANDFIIYMNAIYTVFGDCAFAKYQKVNINKKMSSFNAAVFDAIAVGFSDTFSHQALEKGIDRIVEQCNGHQSVFSEEDFFDAVSGSVNDAAKVKVRIERMIEFFSR